MNHMVNECPSIKFGGGLHSLHEAGDDAIHWLESTMLQHSPNEIQRNTVQHKPYCCVQCRTQSTCTWETFLLTTLMGNTRWCLDHAHCPSCDLSNTHNSQTLATILHHTHFEGTALTAHFMLCQHKIATSTLNELHGLSLAYLYGYGYME